MHDRPGSHFGTLVFEVRGPGEDEYRSVAAVGHGEISFVSTNFPLPPKGRMISSEALVRRHPDQPLFSGTGKYSIRVKMGPGEIPLAKSAPIVVLVEPPRRYEVESLESAIVTLNFGIGLNGVSFFHDATKYTRTADSLDDSELRRTLLWMARIAQIRDTTDEAKRKVAQEELEKIRKEAHPFMQDWISLTAAAEYIKLKQFDLAKAELAKIKDGNTEKAAAQQRIISIIRDRADARGTPKS